MPFFRPARVSLFTACCGCLLACSGWAPPRLAAQQPDQLFTATREQLDVTKVILALEAAWNRGDLDGYVAHYKDAPDTEAILAGPVRGLSSIKDAFHLNFPNRDAMGTLTDTEVEVRALGEDYAVVQGKYRLERNRKAGGNLEGNFTDILEKTPKGWRIIFSQTT